MSDVEGEHELVSDVGEVFELGSGEDRVQELGSNEGGIKVQVSDVVGVQGLEGESSDVHLSPLFSPSPESPSPLWATEEPYARAESPASSLLKSPLLTDPRLPSHLGEELQDSTEYPSQTPSQ